MGAGEKVMKNIRGNKISIIFQDPMTSLNPTYTIGKQLMEAILLHTDRNKKEAYARAVDMLRLVNVNEPEKRMKQYPFEFSGGMRQRVMIAMALACEPDILIADEPSTALDVTIQAQILDLMRDLQKELGMAIIMITHDLGVVAQMCDEVIVMYAGSICEQGTADEIFYNPRHEYTKGLLNSIPTVDTVGKKLQPITGTPIDLLNMPKGCPFAPRCNAAMKICLEQKADRMQINDDHMAGCWMNVKRCLLYTSKAPLCLHLQNYVFYCFLFVLRQLKLFFYKSVAFNYFACGKANGNLRFICMVFDKVHNSVNASRCV